MPQINPNDANKRFGKHYVPDYGDGPRKDMGLKALVAGYPDNVKPLTHCTNCNCDRYGVCTCKRKKN